MGTQPRSGRMSRDKGAKRTMPAPRRAAPDRRAPSRVAPAVLLAVFVSGVAGLMHQVVWARLLVQLIGATAHAQAAVLGVFMGGLAVGAVALGRRADRTARPLMLYAGLEALIGGYCLLLPVLLWLGGRAYVVVAAVAF